MKIALITISMSKFENDFFKVDADSQVALVPEITESISDELIGSIIREAPNLYPGWDNYKAKVSYVDGDIVVGLLNG